MSLADHGDTMARVGNFYEKQEFEEALEDAKDMARFFEDAQEQRRCH